MCNEQSSSHSQGESNCISLYEGLETRSPGYLSRVTPRALSIQPKIPKISKPGQMVRKSPSECLQKIRELLGCGVG